jgi:hypothetical protein
LRAESQSTRGGIAQANEQSQCFTASRNVRSPRKISHFEAVQEALAWTSRNAKSFPAEAPTKGARTGSKFIRLRNDDVKKHQIIFPMQGQQLLHKNKKRHQIGKMARDILHPVPIK